MDPHLRQPEEILAYRSLPRILASKPSALWTVGPSDTARAAMQLMADKHVGFLIVLEHGKMVGVVSERDFARRLLLAKKPPETTQVAEIMTREVISVDLTNPRSIIPANRLNVCLQQLPEPNSRRHLAIAIPLSPRNDWTSTV